MEPFKNCYSPIFYAELARDVRTIFPSFDGEKFLQTIMPSEFESMELKDRMQHTARVLHDFLPEKWTESSQILRNLVTYWQNNNTTAGIADCFLGEYISLYGLEDFDISMQTIEVVTQHMTCEFAVRPFFLRYGEKMLQQMYLWTHHKSEHVRRLASEGSRPRLPWAMALPMYKQDPTPLLPLLDNLMNDDSEYVRRSVANHLNDISHDHPDIFLTYFRTWHGRNAIINRLLKHASRTLLKAGNLEILGLYNLSTKHIEVSEYGCFSPNTFSNIATPAKPKQVFRGETVGARGIQKDRGIRSIASFSPLNRFGTFSTKSTNENGVIPIISSDSPLQFTAKITSGEAQKIRIEYALYFLRKNGTHSKKVFKISERELQAHETITITKSHSFRPITTRTYYPGTHFVALVINGREWEKMEFLMQSKT